MPSTSATGPVVVTVGLVATIKLLLKVSVYSEVVVANWNFCPPAAVHVVATKLFPAKAAEATHEPDGTKAEVVTGVLHVVLVNPLPEPAVAGVQVATKVVVVSVTQLVLTKLGPVPVEATQLATAVGPEVTGAGHVVKVKPLAADLGTGVQEATGVGAGLLVEQTVSTLPLPAVGATPVHVATAIGVEDTEVQLRLKKPLPELAV
jgi:hypothetical protein